MPEKEQIEQPDYSDVEKDFRTKIITDLSSALQQRSQEHPEFDEMDYVTYWKSNAKAANAYLPPKVDEQDVRTTSGTTLEKKNTLLNALLNLNLEPDIEAYDRNDEVVNELGTAMEDLLRKSRKIERYDQAKRPFIYNEFIAQGTVFVEERFDEYRFPNKELVNMDVERLDQMKWEKRIDKVYKECNASHISGINVYLGNIREPDITKQPFVALRRLMTYEEANALYGEWGRFKHVPKIFTPTTSQENTEDVDYNNWTLEAFENNMVEELRVFYKWSNDFMIMLNGVMMFPVNENGTFPLSALTGTCEYPVAMAQLEPITNFAYGKSIPAKTKVNQALFDEMLKSIVIKTRKSYNPPLANGTGQTISKRVLHAGHIEDDINPEKLQPIGDNSGVSQSEFNAIQFIKSIIDGNSVDPIMEGQSQRGNQTAREIVELKQQSMMRMGLTILGAVNLEKQLAKLRLYNILNNWTEPVEEGIEGTKEAIYRTVSVEASFDDGTEGTRVIRFTENLPDDMQVAAEDDLRRQLTGKNVRSFYLNPKMLRSLDYKWYIEVTPTEKSSNALKQAQFEESVIKAGQLFVPFGKMPNWDYLAQRWATNQGEDPDKFWQQAQPEMGQMGGQPPMGQAPNQVGAQLTPSQPAQPSVNAMVQGGA